MMNQLVKIKKNDVYTDSWIVAVGIGREHDTVTKSIKKFKKDFEELGKIRFMDCQSENPKGGRPKKIYELDEAQAIFLLTLMDNSKIVVEFKKALSLEFVKMRQFILERKTAEWQQSRLTGKKIRKDETDVILESLIPLAESQGSNNAGKLYMVYSKLVNNTLGIEAGRRDNLPLAYVDAIRFLERAISNIISIEAGKGTYYKEIY